MAKRAIGSRLKRLWISAHRNHNVKNYGATDSNTSGFTLLELLVATAIGGSIIAGLMFMVVQLTNTDLRESSRSETQREMQMALDYMSTELREAVYVYSAGTNNTQELWRISQFLPESVVSNNSVPVLAFWKYHRYPESIQQRCRSQNAEQTADISSCESGASYSLVVYSLSSANPNNIWSNNARITRYALTEFDNQGNRTPGYVNPGQQQNNFEGWTPTVNRLVGSPVTLVDYVDLTPAPANAALPVCPFGYNPNEAPLTPNADMMPQALRRVRSFYACVPRRLDNSQNQDVLLFVRGSVQGRPGYTIAGFSQTRDALPTLETRVLTRGALGRTPPQ
ncbi:hypothetical protein C7B61_09910 [filamentous cyanobacterium CCP1]|nr:hypothetical protein C7B76_03150 [filamentous cyanobacterium CCP2]PSB66721.1 hypothetical protein C7B61_09910 [filamentous cyanobacterium CCP1]